VREHDPSRIRSEDHDLYFLSDTGALEKRSSLGLSVVLHWLSLGPERLLFNAMGLTNSDVWIGERGYSPDGKSDIYASRVDPRQRRYGIELSDLQAPSIKFGTRYDTHPSASPDAPLVALLSASESDEDGYVYDILVADYERKAEVMRIDRPADRLLSEPVFTDAHTVAFASFDATSVRIAEADVRSKEVREVVTLTLDRQSDHAVAFID